MRKNLFGICLSALAISSLLLVACNKEETETVYAPVFGVSPTSIVASAAGGSYSFTYSISNPADDGAVTTSVSGSWIEDLTDTGSGFSFTVPANTGDSRSARITVTYTSSYGSSSEIVTVAQNAGTAPTLSVQPVAVTAETDGGTYSFSYTVTNPAADGELSCSTTADWISDFDYTTSGKVSFTVAANSTNALRSADISVYYDSSYGTLEETVAVVQDHPAGSEGGGGDFDGTVESLIGTYTAHGTVYGNGITVRTSMDWTLKIYAYTGSGNYDIWVDGLIPWGEGAYDYLGTHTYSAYATLSGIQLSIPSQTTGATIEASSGSTYYFGYTPCVAASDTGYSYNKSYPDLTFIYNESTGKWSAEYGVFMAGCTENDITTFSSYFQVVCPADIETFTLTKTASTTSLSVNENKVTHFLSDGLTLYSNFYAE